MNYYTYPGQADAADPSIYQPCKICTYFTPRPFLMIRRHCCAKAKEIHGEWQKPIPPNAMSCKHFKWRS